MVETLLIVIDPIAKIWPTIKKEMNNKTIYHNDYDIISSIKDIADRHNTSILCTHHLSKQQKNEDQLGLLSGSIGISGGIDTGMILKRTRTKTSGTLFITGRDIEERNEAVELNRKTGWWKFFEDKKTFLTQTSFEILNILQSKKEPISLIELTKITKKSKQNLNKYLRYLIESGYVDKVNHGIYRASIDNDDEDNNTSL